MMTLWPSGLLPERTQHTDTLARPPPRYTPVYTTATTLENHKTTPYFRAKCTKYKASDDAACYAKSIPDSTLPPRDLVLFASLSQQYILRFAPIQTIFACPSYMTGQEWLLIALLKVEA
jgi:hypothetical protein